MKAFCERVLLQRLMTT